MDTFIRGQKLSRRRQPLRPGSGKGYVSILEGGYPGTGFRIFGGKGSLSRHDAFAPVSPRDKTPEIIRPRPSRPHASPRSVRYTAPFINVEALRVGWRRLIRSVRIRSGLRLDAFREGFGAALKKSSIGIRTSLAGISRALPSSLSPSGIPFSPAGVQRFKGSLLEPGWLLFIDSVPSRLVAIAARIVVAARKSPLRFLGAALSPIVAIFALSAILTFANQPSFPLPGEALLPDENTAQELLMAYVTPELTGGDGEVETPKLPALPVGLETRRYTVRKGDSLATVARKFRLRQDTLIAINNIKDSAGFKVGMELKIPNMDGVMHRVRPGESLPVIAKKYGVDMTKLVDTNDIASANLRAGSDLFIPGAKLSPSALQGFYAIKMIWPTRGRVSSPYGYRSNPFTGVRTFHAGIDIVVNTGTPVKSIMEGRISDTGYNGVFGNYIIIAHAESYQTLYGHLSSIGVKEGQTVSQGSVIGRSGNSGYSTGPHLHFGLFKKGSALDPAKYIK